MTSPTPASGRSSVLRTLQRMCSQHRSWSMAVRCSSSGRIRKRAKAHSQIRDGNYKYETVVYVDWEFRANFVIILGDLYKTKL